MPRTAGHRRERARAVRGELVVSPRGELAKDPRGNLRELYENWIASRQERTRRAYAGALRRFARYVGADEPGAIAELLLKGPVAGNSLALKYKGALMDAGKSPAMINLTLSALRSVVELARSVGFVSWALDVRNERVQPYRDNRGPGRVAVQVMLAAITGDTPKALRDRAILRLLYDLALRRGEVASLRLEDLDIAERRVWIRGKGRGGEREGITLPGKTAEALAAWAAARGNVPGPLFVNFDRAGKGRGITGLGVWHLVGSLGRRVGLKVRPHGIRHSAITEALDRTRDPRAVQRFSRHRDLRTVLLYDDNREDLAGKVAETVAAGL